MKNKQLNLTSGPILSTLTELALPIMASSFLATAYNITDMAWIGMLGSKAVAGVGVGGMYVWLSQGLCSLSRMGGQVNMAQALGRKDREASIRYADVALQLTILFGLFFTALCLLFTDPLLHFFNLTDPEAYASARVYMLITCGLLVFSYLNLTLTGLSTAQGDSKTPLMAKSDLYKISGHWDHYKEGMFVLGDEDKDKEVFALRPMTCPFQYYVYKASQKSYRDLPCRYGETSTLFRNEDSGEMHGLTRVRQFTISEGHLIVRPDQMVKEFKDCIALAQYCLQTLGLEEDVTYHLSKWDPENPEKYIGEPEVWNETEEDIRNILNELNIPFTEDVGEAAFYGPKVDINAKNVYGKEDTMITIQWDALLADQFDMYYIDEKGDKVRPYIIHRTSIGCYERTLAWLIEKYAGMFPTWLCPEQVRVLPISEKYADYAENVCQKLTANGVDATVDNRSEKIGFKIREARLQRIPYMLIVGQKEQEENKVSLRSRYKGDEGQVALDDFIADITEEIRTKEIRKIEVSEEK